MSKPSKRFDQNAFIQSIIQKASVSVRDKLFAPRVGYFKTLAAQLERAGNKEVARIFPMIANQLIGARSGGSSGKVALNHDYILKVADVAGDPGGSFNSFLRERGGTRPSLKSGFEVTWPGLSASTVKRKGNNQFFVNTGHLQAAMSRYNPIASSRLGGVTVEAIKEYTADEKETNSRVNLFKELGRLEIKIYSRLPNARLLALSQARFDDNGGFEYWVFGPNLGKKLKGPEHPRIMRHLVQPVLSYYMNYKIPGAIFKSISRTLMGRASAK